MSDTPMVDDRWQYAEDIGRREPVVLAAFARHLERELNEQRKINQALALKLNSYERGILVGKGTITLQ